MYNRIAPNWAQNALAYCLGSSNTAHRVLICVGTQSASHWDTLAKLCGGALQFAQLSGAITVSFRDCFLGGVWRSENRGTGK